MYMKLGCYLAAEKLLDDWEKDAGASLFAQLDHIAVTARLAAFMDNALAEWAESTLANITPNLTLDKPIPVDVLNGEGVYDA